jgi:DedD protein
MDRRVKERLVGATILMVLIVLIVPELLSGPKARLTPVPPSSSAGPVEAVRNVTVDLATSKATQAENTPAENALADSTAASAASPSAESATATGAPRSGDAASGAPASGDATDPGTPPSAEPAPGEAAVGVPSRTNRAPGSPTIATLKAQQPARAAKPELESEPSIPRSAPKASNPGNETAPTSASNHHWAVQIGSFASRANAEKLVRQRKPHDAAIYMSPSGKGPSARYRVRIGPLADRDAAERVVAKLKKEGQSASLVPP